MKVHCRVYHKYSRFRSDQIEAHVQETIAEALSLKHIEVITSVSHSLMCDNSSNPPEILSVVVVGEEIPKGSHG